MADVNANIGVHIDTSAALAELKNLQRQLATFHSSVAKNSSAAAAAQKGLQTNLLNAINATGQFQASMGLVRSSTESFTHALETNKLSMREYFRYASGSTRTFGRLFRQEFDTIGKVAEERVKKMQTQYIKMGRDASGAIKAMSITPTALDMDNYATKTAIAAQKQAILNQLLKQGSTNLLNFGKNTQWAGRQLMVGFTIPLMYFGGAASKVFMDLEAQAIKFKRVYGDMFTTKEETNKALADVQELAKEFTKYGVAVTKTIEMAASAAAMGKTGAELTAQVAGATRLAVLGGVEQAQALETTISVTNAFGIAAEDLASKINFLNAVENQTVVSIEDLTEAIPKAGPVVKQLGGSVEDLAFFLTAMKEGGINASEGANALKSGLASLINPSDKAAGFLGKLGININKIVETNKGNIRNTVIDFSRALDTLDPLNRARAIEQLFGKFQFSRLSTLFQNVTKDGTQASRVLQLATSSVEELAILSERELGVLENAVGTNFRESVEKLKLAIAPIGETFLKAITPIVEVVGRLLDKFNGLGDGTKKFIVIASTLVGAVGPVLLMTFGLLANGVANIIKLFITMRSGFLRAGTNTNILAQQTQYLNAEQLESATVAASLNQVHTRLTQSFTLEANAVSLLRKAYIDATVAASNFSRANPGMMMPMRGGKPPRKFASGATYVPGTGNKDTVPSMLTPGEAVIPAPVAQDPRFQPIIDAMVNGKLQGFNGGSTGVNVATKINDNTISFDGKVFSPVSKSKIDDLVNRLNAAVETDPNRKEQLSKRMTNLLDPKSRKARGKEVEPLTPSNVQVSESRKNKAKERTGSDANTSISKARREIGYRDPITGKRVASEKMDRLYTALRGAGLDHNQARNFIGMNESHIQKVSNKELKWFEGTVIRDVKGLNNYLNRIDPNRVKPGGQGSFEKLLLEVEKDKTLLPKGFDEKRLKQLRSDFDFIKSGRHPITPTEVKSLMNLAEFDEQISQNKGLLKKLGIQGFAKKSYQAKGVKALIKLRGKTGLSFYKSLDPLILGGNTSNPSAMRETIDLGERINKSSGRGGGEVGKAIDGEYRINDRKVFVKGFESLDNAKAEMKANALARNLHGLISPEGHIRMVPNPNNTGGKVPVLISDFDPRFTEESMKKQKFDADNMVKQLVASALRGDKDVKTGNMSGNFAVDPGTAYIYDKASGVRTPATQMPSMEEMIEKNLGLVKGGASLDFSKNIEPLMRNMTAEEFDERMKKEIKRLVDRADDALIKSGYSASERKAIKDRLSAGLESKNFKSMHDRYLVGRSVAVKPGEVLEEKGKIKPIPTIKKPKRIKTASSKDTLLAPKEVAPKVRNVPRNALGMTPWVPGRANAPFTNLPTSQGMTQLSSGLIIPASQLKNFTQSIEDNTESNNKNTKTTDEGTKTSKEQKREMRAQRAQRVGSVAGPIAGVAGMGAMAGYMTGNMALGNTMMGISALASIAPMLTNPLNIFIASMLASAAVIYKFNKDISDARKEGVKLAKGMSMSADRVRDLSMISGKIGASEIQARKRQNLLNPLGEEQRQFGQNVLQSDTGKKILSDVEGLIKQKFSTEEIGNILGTNLSQAVLQGAVSADQAASIASALGEELGSYAIPLNVTATINKLLGPNGENLEKNPLKVALDIKKESMKNVQSQFDFAKNRRKQEVTAGGAGMLAAGGLAGAGALAATGIGVPIAAAVSVALIGKALYDQNKARAANAKLDAAAIQLGIESIGQNQQLIDAVNEQYDKKIKIAKTEKEINDLQAKRKTDLAELNKANSQSLAEIIKLSSAMNDKTFNTSISNAASDKFKNASSGTKLLADAAQQDLLKVTDQNMRRTLQIGFVSDNGLSPASIIDLATFVSSSDNAQKQIDFFIKQHGFAELETLQQVFGKFGESAPTQTREYMLNYINSNSTDLKDDLAGLNALASFKQQYGVTLDVQTNGVEDLATATAALGVIADQPDTLTKQQVLDLAVKDPNNFGAFAKDFDALSQDKSTISKYLYVNYKIASNDPKVIEAAAAAKMSVPEYIAKGFDLAAVKATPGATQTPEQGKRLTYLDDLLKRLKLTRDAAINATKGIGELRRVLSKSGGDIKIFKGVNQQLRSQGINQEFIDFVGDLDPAIQKKFITIKNGIVSITKDGKNLAAALNEAVIGELEDGYQQQVDGLKAQSDKFIELKATGLSAAEALSIVTNEQVALALASGKSKEEIDKIIVGLRKVRAQEQATLATINPAKYVKEQIDMAQEYYDVLEREARNIYQPQIDAVNKLIDANEKLIETKQRDIEINYDRPIALLNEQSTILNHDLSLIDKATEAINKKYSDQEKALNQISEINAEIAEQERGRLSIVNALVEGDVASAAKALQEQRQAAAQAAQERSLTALQSARDAEIAGLKSPSGLTKIQIEQKLYDISEQIYALEQKQIPVLTEIKKLQDANYNYQVNSIAPLQAKLDKELEAIDVQRKKWNDVQLSIDGAKVRSTEYQNALKGIEDTLKKVKSLWDDIATSSTKATSSIGGSTPTVLTTTVNGTKITVPNNPGQAWGFASGGMVPKYFAAGGFSRGTDTIPAMLTAGEYVVRKSAVDSLGIGTMNSINNGNMPSSPVYNYSLSVNVEGSNSSPDDIARTVMSEIKRIDSQRVRGIR
jgi:TP901 family phage tail tape measure protein